MRQEGKLPNRLADSIGLLRDGISGHRLRLVIDGNRIVTLGGVHRQQPLRVDRAALTVLTTPEDEGALLGYGGSRRARSHRASVTAWPSWSLLK